MPSSQLPSFASAAAGQAPSRDSRGVRGDGRGSGDWARRENRGPNGTLTLRRSSTTPFAQSSTQDAPLPTPTESLAYSAHPSTLYEGAENTRYSKEQLLDVYKSNKMVGSASGDVTSLLHPEFDPWHGNGANGRASWGKSSDGRDTNGPNVCWDKQGSHEPISLQPLTDEEKSAFAGDVNSPLKPPPQNANKDPNAQGANGRKTSVSHGQGNAFNTSSPASSRPSTRRQQTSDSISGLNSPLGSRFNRDDNSPYFRKFGDGKDLPEDRGEDTKPNMPFGSLMRANTAGSGLGGPASPWGASSAAMSPMGNFGSFPAGQSGVPPTPTEKRPGYGSMRGESRLAHLMPKESSEDIASKAAERQWRPRQRTDTDPFGDEVPSGSAALGGGQDTSPPLNPQQRVPGVDTPVRGNSGDFGMSEAPSFRDSQRGSAHQTPHKDGYDPMSPSITNPYASPADNRRDADDGNYDEEHFSLARGQGQGLGGIPEHGPNLFANQRAFSSAIEGSDRSQTSSATGNKPFPGLGGLHGLGNLGGIGGGWPTSGNPVGTPDREHRAGFSGAFGNSLFGTMDNVQSPSLGPIGGMFGQGSSTNLAGTAGRGSKLGSLFPAAMQAQMHVNDNDNSAEHADFRQNNAFGAIGRGGFPSRETDSPLRTTRHPFEDLFPQTDGSRNQLAFSSVDAPAAQTTTAFSSSTPVQSNYQQSQASSDSASNQLPATQQRMMVMPDRMRWVYLDPQGQVQGPWSGLEMHDWYKASFFTADLSVKKVEDAEFEPLGQLIRRIGNSREPFLVPQIGIPHGPPAPAAGTPFTSSAAGPGTAQPGSVQPPFAGAFPSFGTTLTAEQQNNLERRKQEEQYLMARQREYLAAQQQVNMGRMQQPLPLHHHSSAHSLQSQPSLGSMTSPIGMGPQAHLPNGPGFFERPQNQALPSDFFREEDLARLSIQDRQQLFGSAPPPPQLTHAQQIASMFPQNVEPPQDAVRGEQVNQDDPQGFKARLHEFNMYQKQNEAEEAAQAASVSTLKEPIGRPQPQADLEPEFSQAEESEKIEEQAANTEPEPEILSLTQQVQKAASNKQSPVNAVQPESPWAKVETGLPMPFPPPQSTTPLPAPNPQRSRANLPEALNMESRSRSETPEVSAPSVAPWAKEPAEAPKGPSLKEIQEAEARKAALAEEAAIAARRAQAEQQLKLISSQTTVPAPGLPTTSTWGNTASPATPTNAPSPWAKPIVAKTQIATGSAASKKTLADIQREEEVRKQKLAAAVSANAQPVQGSSGGKRYADLASKPTTSPAPVGGAAWNTVGAGGKVKVPTGPSASMPQVNRAVSSAAIPSAPSARVVSRPVAAPRSTTTITPVAATSATEEFNKWAKAELTKGLNTGVDVDGFIELLANFPQDASIIADSIYGSSKLMDGRRFAEEYLRRRKLADKGIVEPAKTGSASGFSGGERSGGGWSEVAKKGPPKEEPTAGFKVVPNKKKGKK